MYTCIFLGEFIGISMLDNVFLKYIDAYLLVFGEINTQVMMQKFEICRAKSSRIFTIYKRGETNEYAR